MMGFEFLKGKISVKQNRKHENEKPLEGSIWQLGYSILFSFVCLYLLENFLGLSQITVYHLATALIFSVTLGGFSFFGSRGKILWGLGSAAVLLMGFVVISSRDMEGILNSYIGWLFSNGDWKQEYLLYYELINTLWITVAAFVFCHIASQCFWMKKATAILVLVILLISMIGKRDIQHTGAIVSLVLILLIYLEWNGRREVKRKEGSQRIAVLWLVPFMILYFMMLMGTPAPKKPFDWKFAKDIYGVIKEAAITATQKIDWFSSSEDFDIAFAGFSEEGKLLGSFMNSNKEVMEITTDTSIRTNIYLIGKVFDEFDGEEWVQTDYSEEENREADTLETIYAVRRHYETNQGDYIYQTGLQIRYKYLNTSYLFAPLKSWKLYGKGSINNIVNQGGGLLFTEKKGYGDEYNVLYMQLNLDSPGFYEMIDVQQDYCYGEQTKEAEANRRLLYETQRNYMSNSEESTFVTEEILQKKAEKTHEIYAKPVILSEELRGLLDIALEEAKTDVEKLKIIEAILLQLSYTNSPSKLPFGKDILDYFILESKEGYCSYFATAFVLLARAEGIPARYVQGFCVPTRGKRNEMITVNSGMAHAWPEAYIDGVGWIPFEPTPGFDKVRYTPWKMASWSNTQSNELHYIPQVKGFEPKVEESAEESKEIKLLNFKIAGILMQIGLLVLAVGMALYLIDTAYARRKYRKMSFEDKMRLGTIENLNILSMIGYARKEGETLHELKRRAEEGFGEDSLELCFIQAYEEVRYGKKIATDNLVEEARRDKDLLLAKLKRVSGKRYPYHKFRLYFKRNKNI